MVFDLKVQFEIVKLKSGWIKEGNFKDTKNTEEIVFIELPLKKTSSKAKIFYSCKI